MKGANSFGVRTSMRECNGEIKVIIWILLFCSGCNLKASFLSFFCKEDGLFFISLSIKW